MKTRIPWMGLILLATVVSSTGWAVTRTVDDDGPADFATIQPAINASNLGDTVFVMPGVYNGPITMKGGVKLLGYGPHVTTITGNNTAIHVVSFNSSIPSILSGFRIIGSNPGVNVPGSWHYSGVYVQSGPLTIRNNIIEDNKSGIAVEEAGRPSIINNTIVDNITGVVFAGDATPFAPPFRVAFIYYKDDSGAKNYAKILGSIGASLTPIPMAEIPDVSLTPYRVLIVAPDTGTHGQWGTEAMVAKIKNSSIPVLGLGDGGASLFQQMSLSINWSNTWYANNAGIYAMDPDHRIFKTPHTIPIPKNRLVQLYERPVTVLEEYGPNLSRLAILLGRSPDDLNHYSLVQEKIYILWGFEGTPDQLTRTGADLFANVVAHLGSRCYPDLPNPVIQATGSEPGTPGYTRYQFRVTNWYAYPDELFEPSPDLPPCGLNENASRTWVEIYNALTGKYIYGFCALDEAHDLHDRLSVSFPTGETPPPIYIKLVDRRCDATFPSNAISLRNSAYYSHTIMNNIIASNHTGIFYYAFLNEGRILYNDVWNNAYRNYHDNATGTVFVPQPGTGEISANPLFVNLLFYRLTDESPCKDTGNPDFFYNDPDGSRNDMGAYGGPGASGRGEHSGSGFIFTSVGNIPTSEIVQELAQPTLGLADVDATTALALGIPAYDDSPFGGSLYINGLFGDVDIANGVKYYQILLGKWTGDTPPDEDTGYTTLTDALYKIRYSIDGDGDVIAELVNLGAKTIKGVPNCYELTSSGWWSNLDLRVIWNTTVVPNGKYTLKCRAYRDHPINPDILVPYFPAANDLDHLILMVNNTYCNATINSVMYDNGTEIPECGMISLSSNTENLKFNITAEHPDGYLRYWVLDAYYGKNQYAGRIAQSWYPGVVPPNDWPGVVNQVVNSQDGSLVPWQDCAYQFRLWASSRITNGFGYFDYEPYADGFSDHYYLKVGDCAWCGGADINRSGRVDLEDFARLAEQWMKTCGPTCLP